MENKINLIMDKEEFKNLVIKRIDDKQVEKKHKTQRSLARYFGVDRSVIKNILIDYVPLVEKELTLDQKFLSYSCDALLNLTNICDSLKISAMSKMMIHSYHAFFMFTLERFLEEIKNGKDPFKSSYIPKSQ